MGKKKKAQTWEEHLFQERVGKTQKWETPQNETNHRFTRIHHCLMHHPNWVCLSSNAKVVYTYMKEWAFCNKEYIENGTFNFSATLLSTKPKLMSRATVFSSFEELQYYGFIEKVNITGAQSGFTNKWRFSDRWQLLKTNKKTPIDTKRKYVYIMKDGGIHKIGISAKVEKRIAQIAKEHPNVSLVYRKFFDDAPSIEKWLHEKYSDKRVQGEWFNLTDKDVSDVIDFLDNLIQ